MPEWSSNWPPEQRFQAVWDVALRALGKHVAGNAEDCPMCARRSDLPYPWICTGESS